MRRLLIILTFNFLVSCNANNSKKTELNQANELNQVEELNDTRLDSLKKSFEDKDYILFFELFPNNHKELIGFYGYDDKKGEMPLYGLYEKHINYLFSNLDAKIVPMEKFSNKIYSIAINGVWDADAIGLFQTNLSAFIVNYPDVFLKVLSSKSDSDIYSFWNFVFDGSSKNDKQNMKKYETIFNKINSLDIKQGRLLKEEFEKKYGNVPN
jgi:hypothetical protein